MVDIFEYSDFKLFLSEAYHERKSEWRHFSHRYIAQKGSFSAGFFTKIIQGQVKLTDERIAPLCEVFGIYGEERLYFQAMVAYCQSKKKDVRDNAYKKMQALKSDKMKIISEDQYSYFSEWYHSVVREAICISNNEDPEEIAGRIYPNISLEEFIQSRDLLIRLGLIRQINSGYERVDRVISSGDDFTKKAILDFASISINHSRKALFELEKEERQISSLVLSLSEEGAEKVKEKIIQTRREVLDIASEDRNVDRVLQINFQIFPRLEAKK